MTLTVRSAGCYDFSVETFLCLMVEPTLVGVHHQVVEESLLTSPTISCELRQDMYGNPQRFVVAPKGQFSFEFDAKIEVTPNAQIPADALELPPREIPSDVMIYTLPSRYCQSDLLTRMANSEFAGLAPGRSRVHDIAEWVWKHVEYRYGTTDTKTSAYDTATERIGVCRDFAHLVIAFCRAMGIPARYASGYALGLDPPDFHGFAQVYLGGEWHNVDATTAVTRPALVPIAVGRDAADVAIMTTWSAHTLIDQRVEVSGIPRNRN